jgi:ABC-type transport system involved in multi-copper enzyme maturation permease subunit
MRETYRYSDGLSDLYVSLEDGKVTGTTVGQHESLGENTIVFAGVFQFFYLRLAIFFGCLGIFMNLFRGELVDKSLHFYFLAPIRRDLLMMGKYLAGLLAATAIFVTSEALQFAALSWSLEPTVRNAYLQHGHGLAQGATYLGVTALACIGYGSLFLAAGLWFRNPIVPVGVILIWEALNPFLPAVLEKISVIYYLKSLCPVEIPTAPGTPAIFAMLISNPEPVAAPVAIFGLILVSLATLFVASRRVRRVEINYTTE